MAHATCRCGKQTSWMAGFPMPLGWDRRRSARRWLRDGSFTWVYSAQCPDCCKLPTPVTEIPYTPADDRIFHGNGDTLASRAFWLVVAFMTGLIVAFLAR